MKDTEERLPRIMVEGFELNQVYTEYEIFTHEQSGRRYIRPKEGAEIAYSKSAVTAELLEDFLKLGRFFFEIDRVSLSAVKKKKPAEGAPEALEKAVFDFVLKHGMLGLMLAMANDQGQDGADFEYHTEGLASHYFRRSISKLDYIMNFYPTAERAAFEQILNEQLGAKAGYSKLAFMPMAEILEAKKGYAEPVELIALYAEQEYVNFLQWSVPNRMDCISIETETPFRMRLYRNDDGAIERELCTDSMAESLRLALLECYSWTICPLSACKRCGKPFFRHNIKAEFCSAQCRNRYNVAMNYKKKQEIKG